MKCENGQSVWANRRDFLKATGATAPGALLAGNVRAVISGSPHGKYAGHFE